MAYEMVEPGADPRADLRASVIAHTVARGSLRKKNGKPFVLADMGLLPQEPAAQPTDWRALKALWTAGAVPAPKGA